ncbi:MAG: phosphatase PAP2 family protein [Nitrospirae bacterium]|nr:phosphatase PAP2 family protein [Nitrospirota bacterium]MBF0534198.1 phosphatase PAP2 family protein [Nitrospirota bacterium]MBF0615888.1 phosphatase PAP2 family protein [Nitrospirota bacterium]
MTIDNLIQKDIEISGYIYRAFNHRFRKALGVLTHLGDGALWGVLYFLFLFVIKPHVITLIHKIILGEFIGLLIIILLRYVTRRNRPDKDYRSTIPWNHYSFPSHHTFRVFYISFVAGTYYPSIFSILLFCSCVVALSRICLLKHFLTDVLGGIIISVVMAKVLT